LDEKCCFTPATPDEISKAKHLPFLQAVGILSYPASNCKFEMRYAMSVLHGDNVIYAFGDSSLRIPSSTAAETVTLFDCSTDDVMGLRNLLEELGHLQEFPTTI